MFLYLLRTRNNKAGSRYRTPSAISYYNLQYVFRGAHFILPYHFYHIFFHMFLPIFSLNGLFTKKYIFVLCPSYISPFQHVIIFYPGLWIRIHFLRIRIRIQLLFLMRIRIQQLKKCGSGSSLTKFVTNYSMKC